MTTLTPQEAIHAAIEGIEAIGEDTKRIAKVQYNSTQQRINVGLKPDASEVVIDIRIVEKS